MEEGAARVGRRDQGTVKASAVSLVAQEGKQARDISAKELKIGGLEVEGISVTTVNRPELIGTSALPLPLA